MARSQQYFKRSSLESIEETNLKLRRQIINQQAKLLWKRVKLNLKKAATIRNAINVTFILIVCSICFQQCYTEVRKYFRYETKIQVSHIFPSSTLWLLPGVTICNNNRIRLTKLMQESQEFQRKFSHLFNATTISLSSERKRIEMMRTIKSLVDESVNITTIINESPIPKLIELSRLPMIKDVNCNGLWGQRFNCENFRIMESFQASPCYTMFYLGSILEALANGNAYDFTTSLLGGGRKNDSFANHEVGEILVDFEPLQHADFQRDVGGKIVIHSTGHVGSIRDMAHSILPGHKYDIIIQRSMSKRLPPPYTSMCFDYKVENSHKFTSKDGSMPSIELDKTTCTRNCIVRKTTKSCNCWPVEVPFYLGDNFIKKGDSFRMCSWGFKDAQRNHSAALYVDCYKRFHAECRSECRPGCRTEDYKVNVLSNPWPTRDMYYRAKNDEIRADLQRLKSCCALISLKYLEFMENRLIMYPSVTLAQLVSNIGGIVSALVGVSGVSIYRYVTRRVLLCKVVSNYKPQNKLATSPRG